MALTYTSYPWEFQSGTAGGDITTTSRTYNSSELVVVLFDADINDPNNLTVTNSGTAQTWNLIRNNGIVVGNEQVAAFYCVMSATQAMTITVSGDSATVTASGVCVIVHAGQNSGNPVPVGNVFGGTGGTDISQSITPTATGSCLWLFAGNFTAANSFAPIANCSTEQTGAGTGFSVTLIRPTTQPRADANAFTIGETDSAGTISWIAFEVQAAAAAANIAKNALPKKRRLGRRAYEFSQFFDATFNVQGAFDKDIALFPAAGGNTGSIASVNQSDSSSLTGIQTASGSITSRNQPDRSQLTGVQTASGAIQSLTQSDRSQLTGLQTATGNIQSFNQADRSSLTGLVVTVGTIASRNNGDTSALSGVQAATGAISSVNQADRSALTGLQTATGSIQSFSQSDRSALAGTSGSATTGVIGSLNNSDTSALTGTQTASGAIQSRNRDDLSALAGALTATGTIQSRNNSDNSALAGFQPVTGLINSFNQGDLSSLSGFAGSGSTGNIQSFNQPDRSFAQQIVESLGHIGGDDAPHGIYWQDQPKREIKRKELDRLLDKSVKEFFEEVSQDKKLKKKAKKIVKPYEQGQMIDWISLESDLTRVQMLLDLYIEYLQALDEEEILILLLAMV